MPKTSRGLFGETAARTAALGWSQLRHDADRVNGASAFFTGEMIIAHACRTKRGVIKTSCRNVPVHTVISSLRALPLMRLLAMQDTRQGVAIHKKVLERVVTRRLPTIASASVNHLIWPAKAGHIVPISPNRFIRIRLVDVPNTASAAAGKPSVMQDGAGSGIGMRMAGHCWPLG